MIPPVSSRETGNSSCAMIALTQVSLVRLDSMNDEDEETPAEAGKTTVESRNSDVVERKVVSSIETSWQFSVEDSVHDSDASSTAEEYSFSHQLI